MTHRLRDLSLRIKLHGAFALLVVCLLILGAITFRVAAAEQEASRQINASREVTDQINDVLWSVSRMQTAYRSYLLTGSDGALRDYGNGADQFSQSFTLLKKASLDDPDQFGRWRSLDQQASDWQRSIVKPGMALRSSGAPDDEVLRYLQEHTGYQEFQAMAALLQEGLSYQHDLLARYEDDVQRNHQALKTLMIGSPALAVVGGGGLAWLLARDIGRAMSRLRYQARRISSGDLSTRIRSPRCDEIGQTANALDEMADQLQRAVNEVLRSEQAATERANRIHTILDNVAEGLLSFKEDGLITAENPAARCMLAPVDTTLIGRHFTTLLADPGQDEGFFAQLLNRQDTQVSVSRTTLGKRLPDTTFPLELIVKEVPDGPEREFIAILRDITEQQEAEHRLEEQAQLAEEASARARAILDTASEAMVLLSDTGLIQSVNQRFGDLFAIDRNAMVGRPVRQFTAHLHRTIGEADHLTQMIMRGLREPGLTIEDSLTQIWPRHREFEFFAAPVVGDHGERLGRLYAFRDVTHHREVDRLKDQFVSLVSHELRTPLTAIRGYTDLLLDGTAGELGEDQQEFLEVIAGNARRLSALVNDLLDLSSLDAGKIVLRRGSVDLESLVLQVVTSLRPVVSGKNQTIHVSCDGDLPPVSADAARVTQIVTNLMSNANKYTSEGGRIEVELHRTGPDVVIDVRDSGIGMTEDEVAHLFERFYRARNRATREVAGTGLGLSITRSLVELHGGEITVRSEPGAGSTFSVRLPIEARQRVESGPVPVEHGA